MRFIHKNWTFELSPGVLGDLAAQRQLSCLARENGGQLFARFRRGEVRVEALTVTRGSSRRTRYGFWPDRDAERADIARLFGQGLHYVGDWHSHPELMPSPSQDDKTKMLEIFRQSNHELVAMLMVIVGQADFPKGLYVGTVSGDGVVSPSPDVR